jgi:hypothetical protein
MEKVARLFFVHPMRKPVSRLHAIVFWITLAAMLLTILCYWLNK